ncbi:MAG: peroxidase family protein, partial [Pirellulales bacterium]
MSRRTPNHLSQIRSRAVARRRRLGLERLDERLLLNVDWRNPADSLDVNGDGQILPLDALLVINDLNFVGPRRLPAEHTEGQPYFDSSGDQSTAPLDALLVINAVNNGVSSYRVLREGTQLATDSSVTITLGQSSGTRSYRVAIEADFGSDPPQVAGEDTLVVYLVDPAAPANTLLDRQTPGTSLFTLTGDRADYVPGLVQWDGAVLQIDLSSVTTRTTGELKFQLLNGDSDTNARITLKPLSNVADPEGQAPPRLWPDAVAAASDSTLNLAGLQDGGSAQVVWDNVRYQETTGRYLFDLRVDNPGTVDLGRTLAVAFPGLPAGVTLLQAAGTTAAGAPYLNLSPLTPPGGLARGQFSQRVVVELANPTGVSFVLQPVVLAGVNRAPVFDPVGPLTVSPGGVLAVRLSASDPDGDRVTFALGAGQRPTGTLRADGLMTFRPELDEVGHYSFSLVASDGRLNAARTVEIDVVADPDPVTRVSGWVQRIDGGPLEGVPVEIAGFSSTTDATGHFVIALPTMKTPTESFPIAIPADDPFLDPFHTGDQEIRFRRSRYDVTTGDSVVNPRQHPNLVSSFLDASMVYGATPERAAALRTLAGGRLKSSAGDLLPRNDGATFPAGTLENDNEGRVDPAQLFVSGDVRTNENVPLIALHTVLLREHNRLADEIAAAHPELSDEAIYQQARQLVGALIQQITYSEYLPLLLGPDALPAYSGYDPQVNPGESELFATAAFRVGHTQLFSEIQRLDADGLPLAGGSLTLREAFFTPQPIQQDGIEPYLRGLAASQAEQTDIQIIDDVRNFLFGPPGSGGMDLAAMNIQRGRDVGLPSYNQARVDFGLPPVTSFADITSDVAAQQALGSLYGSVDDIDVWVGGIAEDHAPDALVGPLFRAIIGDQFRRTRDGDRFWYENGQLTDAQLNFVRGTTLSGLIQRNTSITGLPDHVFTQGLIPSAPAPAGSAASVPATEFRSYDGSGNHATQTDWGKSSSLVLRNFTNGYGDGISTPGGANRPGPREISNAAVAQDFSNPDSTGSTGFLVFWGQFIDHDLGLTPGGVSDTLKILGNLRPNPTGDDAYPFVAERMDLMLDHPVFPGVDNVIARPIYLPHLDLTNGQMIDPNVDAMVTTESIPAAALQVDAGNLHNRQGVPYAGVLSITEVPTGQTPAALPPGMSPDLVVTIQPADLVFSTPAPLTLPNRSGAPAGTSLDLWSINPITGTFDVVGEGVVSNDGTQIQTVSGGIRNSSWQFFLPRPEQLNELRNNVRNQKDDCVVCRAAEGFTSEVEAHSGAVIETHALVSYRSLEETRQVVLTYDSQRADPRPIVHFDYANVLPGGGRLIYATATVSDGSFTYQVPGFQAPQAPTDFHDLRIVAGCPPWDLGGGSVHDGSCTVNGSSDL